MKLPLAFTCGIGIAWAAVAIWPSFIGWVFTRVPPATHPDCTPRYSTWHHGERTEGAWT